MQTLIRRALKGQAANWLPFRLKHWYSNALPGCTSAADRATQPVRLAASDGADGDYFGHAVCLSGNLAVIGVPGATVEGDAVQGIAYLFRLTSQGWIQIARLTAADAAGGAGFGSTVATDGDTVVVGADAVHTGEMAYRGTVYVFTRNGNKWTQTATFMAGGKAALDAFGSAIAIQGSVMVVGESTATINGQAGQGVAYVYRLIGGMWIQTAIVTANDGAAGHAFGSAVAVSGNLVTVGAPGVCTGGRNDSRGAVYVYALQDGEWRQTAKFTSDERAEGVLGNAVAMSGNTIVAGVHTAELHRNLVEPVACVYQLSNGAWTQAARLKAGAKLKGAFTTVVSVSGNTIAVSAQTADAFTYPAPGIVSAYRLSNGSWQRVARFTVAAAGFGRSVSLSGNRVLIGAKEADADNYQNQGVAYACELADGGLALEPIGNLSGMVGKPVFFVAAAVQPDMHQPVTFGLADAPEGACMDAATGAFCYVPAEAGNYTFTVRVTASAPVPVISEEIVTLTVVPPLPTALHVDNDSLIPANSPAADNQPVPADSADDYSTLRPATRA